MSNQLWYGAMEQAQSNFTNDYFRDLNSVYAGAGNDRGILVAILILTCITLAVVLSAAAAYLYCNRLALADRILGPRALNPPAGFGSFFPGQPSAPRPPYYPL